MKYLITTIAALVLVGCGDNSKYFGKYFVDKGNDLPTEEMSQLELIEDGTLFKHPPSIVGTEYPSTKGSWKVEGDYLVISYEPIGLPRVKTLYDKITLKGENQSIYPVTIEEEVETSKPFVSEIDWRLIKVDNYPVVSQCRVCKGKVSSQAIACPHCGQPDPV